MTPDGVRGYYINGLEKFLDVEWGLDSDEGTGSRNEKTINLFKDSEFTSELTEFIKKYKPDNIILYEFVLRRLRRRIKHATDILKELRQKGSLEVIDIKTDKINKKGFYLSYDNYINSAKIVKFIIC